MSQSPGPDLAAMALEVFEAMPEGVIVLDGSWRLRYANPVAAQELGRSPEELVGTDFRVVEPGVVGTAFEQAYGRVMRTLVAETVEDEYPPWERWFRNRVIPCGDGLALFFSEVTEDRRARKELLGQLEVLQQVVDHAAYGIVLKDLEGRYLLANRVAAEPTGCAPQEMLGRTAAEFYGPEIAGPLRTYEMEVQRTGLATSREETVSFTPGEPRTFFTVTFPAYDAHGRLVATGSILSDVTDRRRVEAELASTQRRFHDVFAATSLGQVVVQGDGVITEVNDAFCRMAGRSREELVGTSTQDLIGADMAWSDRQARLARRGGGGYDIEEELRRPDGTTLPVLVTVNLFEDARGGPPLVSCIVRDQSHVRALQERLVAAERMEAVGRLASGIAHDVNNVLAAVSGYAQLLSREVADSDRGAPHLAGIFRSVERAGDLVTQLMAFARQQQLVPIEQYLCVLVLDLDDMLRRLLPDEVSLVIQPEAEAPVRADASQLQQVVLNLVLNARNALPDGGTIRVGVDVVELPVDDPEIGDLPAGRYARLVVEDDGVGMPPEVAHRCFEPFFTTRSSSGGNGLGLSTAYGIARQSGGDLRVISAPGQGSRFTLLLPALDGQLPLRAPTKEDEPYPVETAPAPSASGPAPGTQPTGVQVLVADDDPAVLAIVTDVLTELGHEVLTAVDGQSALALVERSGHRPALLVTDMEMPRLDGRGLIARLRERWPDVPVLVVSGIQPAPPGVAFLRKPFRSDDLASAVQQALSGAVAP